MNNTIISINGGKDFKVMPLSHNTKVSKMYDVISMFKSLISGITNPFEIAVLGRILTEQLYIIQSQPIPPKKFKSGVFAVINEGCKCEYYETPGGEKYKTIECDYCKSKRVKLN